MSRVERKQRMKQMAKSEILEWIKIIAVSVLMALIITTFIRPTLVEGESMYPTINEHDYLIISCVSNIIGEPEFGDIIVFETKMKTDKGKEKNLIKRVIGLPGDEINIEEGIVYRNGKAIDEPYINGSYTPGDVQKLTVPENHVFVLGDNRPNSMDSRSEKIGLVDYQDIIGTVMVRLYPFNQIGTIE